jgi:hypothetical protein
MKNNQILVDCDGVLIDWHKSFVDYINGIYNLNVTYNDIFPPRDKNNPQRNNNIIELNGYVIDTYQAILDFNEYLHDFGYLPPIDGAIEGIHKLKALGYNIDVITTCSDNPVTQVRRQQNIKRVFGKGIISKVHCLPLRIKKDVVLKQYEPGSFWVEDTPKNAAWGLDCGHLPIIIEHDNNINRHAEKEDGIYWAKDWDDITNYIKFYDLIINNGHNNYKMIEAVKSAVKENELIKKL